MHDVASFSRNNEGTDFTKRSAPLLKGTVPPKNDQTLNFLLLLMRYQHVADVVVEFYSCVTCVKGV